MEYSDNSKFTILDYAIFSMSLIVSAAVGFYYACSGTKQKTVNEYLFGDHDLKVFPVAMSIVASGTSALGILALASEIYVYGALITVEALSVIVFAPITAFIFLPLFYKLKLSSTYSYLELRFNKTVRRIATCIFLFQTEMWMGTSLYAPASALSQVTGISLWATLVGSSVVCILYTVIGGIKAVVLTDTIQEALVIVGLLAVTIKGIIVMGGITEIFAISEIGQRTNFLDWNPDPTFMYTTWTTFVGGFFLWLPFYAVDQCLVQRYLSMRTIRKAQQAILLTAVIYIGSKVLELLIGWIIYAKYADCDPLQSGKIDRIDQILPLFVMESLSATPGLPGLFVAAIYCASLSALSSGLTAMATVLLEDVIKPAVRHCFDYKFSEKRDAFISKITVLMFGLVTLGLACLVPVLGKTLFQITLTLYGITSGPFLTLFTLGMFFKCIHSWAAGVAILGGVAFTSCICACSFIYASPQLVELPISVEGCNMTTNFTNLFISDNITTTTLEPLESNSLYWLFRLSYFYYPLAGIIVSSILGFALSPIFHSIKPEKVENYLVYSPMQALLNMRNKNRKLSTMSHDYQLVFQKDGSVKLKRKGQTEDTDDGSDVIL